MTVRGRKVAMTVRRWIQVERALLAVVCVVVLMSLGWAVWQTGKTAEYRARQAGISEARQNELVTELEGIASRMQPLSEQRAALGVCVVELLLIEPGTRTLDDVSRVCPSEVVDLIQRERRNP